MLTDPVWWFYLTWLPTYLKRERDISLGSAAGTLAIIYLAADVGSVVGGWLPGRLMLSGWKPGRARLTALLVCALGLPISALAVTAESLWLTVALISVATASVVGFGAMCGGIGGLFMNLVAGGMLQWLGSYTPLFMFAGLMHPLAWILLRWLVRGDLQPVTFTSASQTLGSGVLRWFGVSLLLGGFGLGGVVVVSWGAILEATRQSVAAAAGGVAAALLIGLIGAALFYASRERPMAAL
jgi:ACS family hexuronate transporter-like MFS transporter